MSRVGKVSGCYQLQTLLNLARCIKLYFCNIALLLCLLPLLIWLFYKLLSVTVLSLFNDTFAAFLTQSTYW